MLLATTSRVAIPYPKDFEVAGPTDSVDGVYTCGAGYPFNVGLLDALQPNRSLNFPGLACLVEF